MPLYESGFSMIAPPSYDQLIAMKAMQAQSQPVVCPAPPPCPVCQVTPPEVVTEVVTKRVPAPLPWLWIGAAAFGGWFLRGRG